MTASASPPLPLALLAGGLLSPGHRRSAMSPGVRDLGVELPQEAPLRLALERHQILLLRRLFRTGSEDSARGWNVRPRSVRPASHAAATSGRRARRKRRCACDWKPRVAIRAA